MGRFYINKNGKRIYIKNVDYANQQLQFTEKRSDAYYRDGDYYTNAEKDFIKHHFSESFPELKELKVDDGWD